MKTLASAHALTRIVCARDTTLGAVALGAALLAAGPSAAQTAPAPSAPSPDAQPSAEKIKQLNQLIDDLSRTKAVDPAKIKALQDAAKAVAAEVVAPPAAAKAPATGLWALKPYYDFKPDKHNDLDDRNLAHCKGSTGSADDQNLPIQVQFFDRVQTQVQFGSDGVSTVLSDCGVDNGAAGGPNFADVAGAGTGATVSLQHDGILKKETGTLKGAIGYNLLPADAQQRLAIYSRLDYESQAVQVGTASDPHGQVSYSQKVVEFGGVYRSPLGAINPWATPEETRYYFVYAQPFYIKDDARHSELYGADFRWVPLFSGLNVYNDGPKGQSNAYSGLYWGFILDARLDAAHFALKGTPLGASTTPSGPSKNVVGVPYVLPNQDYARLGGRAGVLAEYYAPTWLAPLLGSKPYNITAYYLDFTALSGIEHGFGEFDGQISVPITSLISIAANYTNGRSENVEARENTWSLSVKFGGAP